MGLFDRRKTAPAPAPGGAASSSADDTDIPRYPPFVRGLPVAAPVRIVATQSELITRLQDGLAFTDARFGALVRPIIERYAAFVHLLPASEAHHHRGAGGLFLHGLEVAFHAAQASQGRIFALDRGPAERRELEPRWRLAAGLAGLCHDAGKPVADLSVSDRAGSTSWRPLLESLTDWAAANGVDHYFLRWRERRHTRHETFGLLVLERILTPEVTAWLVDADPEIMQGLLAAVAGIDDGALTALAMAVLWLPGMLRVWRRHHRLRGKPLAFIASPALERQVGRGEDLWLGWGFDWNGKYRPGVSRAGAARPRILTSLELKALLGRNKGVFSVRLSQPVAKPAAELPIDPYVLGCILGDGTLGKGTPLAFTPGRGISSPTPPSGTVSSVNTNTPVP